MKCLKNSKSNEIIRATDEHATKMVSGSKWSYCSKSEWKEKVRDLETVKDKSKSEKKDKKQKKSDKQSQKLVAELKEIKKGK